MAEATLSILVQLKDQATSKLKGMEAQLKGMGTSLQDVGKVAIGFGGAITGAMTMAVMAAETDREANARLANSLKNVGISYDDVKDNIESTTEALLRNTGTGINEQLDALNKLVLFTGNYNDAISSLPVALDLAAQTGLDLATASKYVGDAFNGESTRLKTLYGIDIPKTDTGMKALADIEAKVGGAAANAASPFKILKGEMEEMASKIGSALLPILKTLVDKLTPIITAIGNFVEKNKGLMSVLVPVIAVIGVLYLAFGSVLLILPSLLAGFTAFGAITGVAGAGMLSILGPIALVVAAIALIVIAVIEIKSHWSTIVGFFKGIWDGIKKIFQEAWQWILFIIFPPGGIIALFIKYWNPIKDFFKGLWNDVKAIFNDFVAFMESWGLLFLGPVGAIIKYWEPIKDFFKGLWDTITGFFRTAYDTIKKIVDDIIGLPEKITGAVSKIPGMSAITSVVSKIPGLSSIFPSHQYGGVVAGAIGEPTPIIAHGGERFLGAGSSAGGGMGGGNMTVHVHVAGSVITERDLADTIRRQLLLIKSRNYTAGLT